MCEQTARIKFNTSHIDSPVWWAWYITRNMRPGLNLRNDLSNIIASFIPDIFHTRWGWGELLSAAIFFCPVSVTEPVCVPFKIKGCSYLRAEGVYTRSARTLSSSEYLLFGLVPQLLSHDGIWRGFCASALTQLWTVPHYDPNSSQIFTFLLGFSPISEPCQSRVVYIYVVWTSWYSDCFGDAKCNSIAGSVHRDIIISVTPSLWLNGAVRVT